MIASNQRSLTTAAISLFLLPMGVLALHAARMEPWQALFFVLLYGIILLGLFSLLARPREVAAALPSFEEQRTEYLAKLKEQEAELTRLKTEKEREGSTHRQRVTHQQTQLHKRDQRIGELEQKVQDLQYEIRTLLQIEKGSGSTPVSSIGIATPEVDAWMEELPESSNQEVRTKYDAYILLQRCVERAQALRRTFGTGTFDIDRRQLFDCFREETSAVIFIYSPSEGKVLFANQIITAFLGWSGARFCKEFDDLLVTSRTDWQAVIRRVSPEEEANIDLTFHAKTGEQSMFHCCLGAIPSGAFNGLLLGILYR